MSLSRRASRGRRTSRVALAALITSGLSLVGFASTVGASPPNVSSYSGPWTTGTYGSGTSTPTTGTSPSGTTSVTPSSSGIFSCDLTISNVDHGGAGLGDLWVYGSQTCSGSYAPQRVGTSIWKIRWYGGQMIAGTNWSSWSSGATVYVNSEYVCQDNTSYWDFYGVITGQAEDGAYQSEFQGQETAFYCG